MSDSWDRAGGPPVDADAFQEWVTHTAESRGVDERELINQLVSAYWILDDMNDVAGDGDSPFAGDMGADESTAIDGPAADGDNGNDGSSYDRSDGGEDSGNHSSVDDAVSREIEALRASIQTQFEMSEAVTELRREVSDLSLEVETQRSRREEFSDRITDELTRLHGRVESIDTDDDGDTELRDRVDEMEHEFDRVEAQIASLEGIVDEVQTDQQELDAWIDDEFDGIESLFHDLIERSDAHADRVDDLDGRLSALADQLAETETDVQQALDAAADREAIADLRREALDAGVDSAACARCGTMVDLSMLDDPVCPDCEATFHGVDADTPLWNPFASPTLTTAPERFDGE